MNSKELLASVSKDEKKMADSLCAMLRVVAVGPENGGPGEAERGKYLVGLAKSLGFESVEVLESKDPKVPTGKRPNIIVRVRGTTRRRLWVVTHMDTVPEGDLSAWKYPPFDPRILKGRIYGRGAEDNGQELIASLFGLKALVANGIAPEYDVGLVMVSDEEHGNTHGIDFLIKKGIFKKGDLAVVPDHGLVDGLAISIVEKSIAWINVEVVGRQTHASTPEKGINAFEAAARFIIASVDSLREKYDARDDLFDPPISTFEATRCESNGPNINTVPGRQVFAFDFRVLPDYPLNDVMTELNRVARRIEKTSGVKINVSLPQRGDAAPKTSEDSEVVVKLTEAIRKVRGKKPHPLGIGGGTCAAPFRRIGIEAAVWSTVPETAHDANEFANVKDLVDDAKVYSLLFAGRNVEDA